MASFYSRTEKRMIFSCHVMYLPRMHLYPAYNVKRPVNNGLRWYDVLYRFFYLSFTQGREIFIVAL